MAGTKDYISLGNRSWDSVRGDLDSWLSRLSTRLDAQEGRSGTPTFYSDLDVRGRQVRNGPPLLSPIDTDFITKEYADRTYGAAATRAQLQITGTAPLQLS